MGQTNTNFEKNHEKHLDNDRIVLKVNPNLQSDKFRCLRLKTVMYPRVYNLSRNETKICKRQG